MIVKLLIIVCLAVAVAGCGVEAQNTVSADGIPVASPTLIDIEPRDVTVCDLKNDPAKYNHMSVKLTGYFSRGFEDSSLYDPACKSEQWIWVELGGKRSVNVMYCCGFTPKPTRDEELKVEDISLPLVDDEIFKKYDGFLSKGKKVQATVVGTFFSGKKIKYGANAPEFYGGYGHMGIGSLFVVQQVITVEKAKR